MVAVGTARSEQVKAFTRAGMGACQGRQCAATPSPPSRSRSAPADVGFYRVRPPLKPITLGELAGLVEETTP